MGRNMEKGPDITQTETFMKGYGRMIKNTVRDRSFKPLTKPNSRVFGIKVIWYSYGKMEGPRSNQK